MKAVFSLLAKDFKIEMRQKFAVNGILLYVFSSLLVVRFVFKEVTPPVWLSIFWLILLFAGINAAGKNFINQQKDSELYYYFLTSPSTLFTARWINNFLSMFLVATVHIAGLLVFFNNPINNIGNFALAVVLGIIGFSLAFTLIAAIASKAQSSALLMSLLSFPVVIPQLLLLVKISNRALIGLEVTKSINDVLVLSSIIAIVGALSYILFPLVWKD